MMTSNQIKKILEGKFENQQDRQYWEKKLAETEAKEARIAENGKYFSISMVYDR